MVLLLFLLQTGTPVCLTMQTYFGESGAAGGIGGTTYANDMILSS